MAAAFPQVEIMAKKWLILACLAGLAALGAGIWVWLSISGKNADTLVLHGNVDIRQVELGFRVDGRIARMLVEEGETVEAGDELALLDNDLLTLAKEQAKANCEVQKANLKKLEQGYRAEEVDQARAQTASTEAWAINAAENHRRAAALRRSGAISQREYDNALAGAREAEANLRKARDNLSMLASGYREEDVLAQRAAVAAAEAALRRASIELSDTVLTAPEKGVVLTRAKEAGAIVEDGQTVYTLALTNPVWLRVFVGEPFLERIKPGMPVEISVDSAPGRRFAGHVGFISPAAEFAPKTAETDNARAHPVYRVRIAAQDSENIMRQGMPVTVRINLKKE